MAAYGLAIIGVIVAAGLIMEVRTWRHKRRTERNYKHYQDTRIKQK